MPQIITGLRIALGIAWLVVVAAEMIAANSGLGYLIIDARNAGKRYDLVVAGMVIIGLIGLALDLSCGGSSASTSSVGVTETDEGLRPIPDQQRVDVQSGLPAPRTRGSASATAAVWPWQFRDLWMSYPGKRRGNLPMSWSRSI